jgi:hypothetical protein
VNDTLTRLRVLLDRVEADGGKVIAIAAVRQALAGTLPEPETGHVLAVSDGRWLIRHPDDCDAFPCAVTLAARKTLTGAPYADGEYEAWTTEQGWLCTQRRQP